jgi:protein CpxP
MTTFRVSTAAALLTASLAANVFAATPAATPPAAEAGGMEHGMHHPRDDFGGHGPGLPGPEMPAGHLHGLHRLHLTEAQQDKLFALEHAAAPQAREQDKAIRRAHDALRELGRAERFDEARAAAVTRDLGQAVAAEALAHARLHAQQLAILTPEQRAQLRPEHQDGGQDRGQAPPRP